jgi:hypothetical protein
MIPTAQKLLGKVAALAGVFSGKALFDFKLEHFGLSRSRAGWNGALMGVI